MSLSSLISGHLRQIADSLERQEQSAIPDASLVLDEYVAGLPTNQNAIDILPGWNHDLPPELGVVAGNGAFYLDPRITWAIEQYGPLEGRKILELGPLEASHTYLLEQHGAASIEAIEANKLSFLRCLVVKELLDLKRSKFYLGDFVSWLKEKPTHYDMIVACGVLYHMKDPIQLLELIAQRTDSFFLWTHYFDDATMPEGDPRRTPFPGNMKIQNSHGIDVRLYERGYFGAWRNKAFCGGMHDLHWWIEKEDITSLIRALGFNDIRIAHDQPDHQNGPCFSLFARRG